MTIHIEFRIEVGQPQYRTIVSILRNEGFTKIVRSEDQVTIMCARKFSNWTNFIAMLNHFHTINGIQRVLPYDPAESWKKHWIIPPVISAVVNMVTLVLLIYTIKPNSSQFDYVILAIVPTILAFAVGVASKLEMLK